MKAVTGILLLILAGLGGGCASGDRPRDYTPTVARFFLENTQQSGTPVALPRSGVRLTVNAKPVITEGDILNVELVQVELGRCLLFQLTPAATRDFYRLSVTQQGRRIVLLIDGQPLGARRIDGAIADGVVYVFVELPDEELPRLVDNLRKTAVALQRELKRQG